jgi:MoaA/NifB/PqqE/SkfB family radical SAM enzyme
LDYAVNRAGLKEVCLTTNAILINKNDAYKKLIDLGIAAIFISTQGADRACYEKIYGVKHYDEVMSGIRHLLEYNRSRGEPARVVIRFRNHEKPSQIIRSPDFQKYIRPFLSERVRVNYTVDFDNWGGTIQPEDLSGCMRLRQLPPALNLPCQRLFNFAVRHDGRVRLCGCRLTQNDNDDLIVGNILEKSLLEISRSDLTWEKIKGFYSGKRPQTCIECTFYQPISQSWLEQRAKQNSSGPGQKII